MSTFTLTGTFMHQDNVTPIVGTKIQIEASPFPFSGSIYGLGKTVSTDAAGQISVTLTTGIVGLYYVARSLAKNPVFDTVVFQAPAAGTTVDFHDLVFYNPTTPPAETLIAADLAAAQAAVASVAASTWQASTSYVTGQTVQAPDGSRIKSGSARTSRASFDATEQTFWTPVSTSSGTIENTALGSAFVKVGYTNHSIMEYAAGATINDGTTSASAAITAALAAIPSGKQRLWLPPGTYLDDAARTISKSVELVGDGATILKGTTVVSANYWTLNADNIKIRNLTFDDSAGKVTGSFLNSASGKNSMELTDCTITAPAAIVWICFQGSDHRLRNNVILGCRQGFYVSGATTRAHIHSNTIKGWKDRGIYVPGDASGASTGLQIVGNTISDMIYNGVTRYPIQTPIGGSSTKHSTMLVMGNQVYGGGKSYNDPTNAGNADCIALFAVDGLRVIGNTARDGGDMGITVDSSVNVAIAGNTCKNNDTGGIALSGSTEAVAITGNVCKNNGQNRHSDRLAYARVGIYLTTASNVAISGNAFGDDQGTKTQQYGVSLTSSTNVSLGPDVDGGNALATYFKNGAGNASIVKVTTAAF